MQRSIRSLALAGIAVLALAGPALAWDSVAISINPDADTAGAGTTAGGSSGAAGPFSGTSGQAIDQLLLSTSMADRPAGDLGPRYEISFSYPGGMFSEQLYPYAPDGPVAYAATDGSIVGHPIAAGWHQGTTALRDEFVAWGLPAAAPAISERTATTPFDRRLGLIAAGLVLLAVLTAGAAAVARRATTVGEPVQARRPA